MSRKGVEQVASSFLSHGHSRQVGKMVLVDYMVRVFVMLALLAGIGCAGHQIPWGEADPRYATGQFVTVDGKQTFYIDQGEGPVVVLLHGIPLSSWEWREFIPVLAQRYRVIAPDLYGFGYSDRPRDADYSWPAYGVWLEDFLDALDVKRATFVGTDLGGPVAFELLTAHPERVSALIIANTFYSDSDETWRMPLVVKSLRWPVTGWLAPYMTMKPMIAMQVSMLVADTETSNGEFVDYIWANMGATHQIKILRKIVRGFRPERLEEYQNSFRAFKGPVLLAWGDQDPVLPPVNVDLFKSIMPQAEIQHYPDAGHFIAQEKPQEFSAHILEFLDRHRAQL